MAYTNLTKQQISKTGLNPTYAAATLTDGNMFTNTGAEVLHVKNGGGGGVVVTIPTPATVKGLDIEDKAVTVPAGEERFIGTFEPGLYNQTVGDPDSGKTYIEYDQAASVTVAVFVP